MSEVETTPGTFKSYTATLVAGTITVKTAFSEIYDVMIQQNAGTPVAESFGWTASGGIISLFSSNGTSTASLRILVRGLM